MKGGCLPDVDEGGNLIYIENEGEANGAKSSYKYEENSSFARFMSDAMFLIPTAQVLQKVITGLDDLYERDIAGLDMQGDLYEYMLSKLSAAGQNGQFRTPKHIRDMMVAIMRPSPDDSICDPACGTAGFLVSAAEYIRARHESKMTQEQWRRFEGRCLRALTPTGQCCAFLQ